MITFFRCGLYGWAMEILWTGLHSILQKDPTLTGRSSLWMFPIYGTAALIGPVYRHISSLPVIARGTIYMCGIFAVEYLTGSLLNSLSSVSLGLQSCALKYQRCDPSGLCASLVLRRTDL